MSTSISDSSIEFTSEDTEFTEVGILVVDEDPAFQLGLKTFLKEYVGFENVYTARNGQEALDLIHDEESIELLTLDYQMPGMDGIEMLKILREEIPRPLGVVMITGFPSEELRKNYANCSTPKLLTQHFLSKPVEFEKLEPIILDCYEELKQSQQITGPLTGRFEADEDTGEINALALAATNRELLAKFDLIEEQLEANTRALREMNRGSGCFSFAGDIAKLVIAGGLILFAWNSGLVDKVKNWSAELLPSPSTSEVAPVSTDPAEALPASPVVEKVSPPTATADNTPELIEPIPPVTVQSQLEDIPTATQPPVPPPARPADPKPVSPAPTVPAPVPDDSSRPERSPEAAPVIPEPETVLPPAGDEASDKIPPAPLFQNPEPSITPPDQ